MSDQAKPEQQAFSNIPEDIAKAMPEATRKGFEFQEGYIRKWEASFTESRQHAEEALSKADNKKEAQDLYQETLQKIETARTYPGGLETQKKSMLQEEADYTDMARRTHAIADRNGLERPQVEWIGNGFSKEQNAFGSREYDGKDVDDKGRPVVYYSATFIDGLSPAARDFVAGHEIAHTTPENQSMASVNRKRAEYLADEFAARQPGASVEAAKEVLSRGPDDGGSDHPDTHDRLKNIQRVINEQQQQQPGKKEISSALPDDVMESLKGISAQLAAHGQLAKQVDDIPTVASNAPAGREAGARGLA